MTREEIARNLFTEGYNCAQAAFGAYAEQLGLDRETAMRLASSFGGGMGKMREVCGAVSGALLAYGMLKGYSDPKDHIAKSEHYEKTQKFMKLFQQENGSYICRELLNGCASDHDHRPEERSVAYYKKRPCVDCVGSAVRLLDALLSEN